MGKILAAAYSGPFHSQNFTGIDCTVQRIDQLLVDQGHASSRAQAQRMIKEGRVQICLPNWQRVSKPGLKLSPDTPLRVTPDESDRYVSRGALKLKAAVEQFNLEVSGVNAIDIGQSTGGFSDYLVQHGAASVLGIEVGHSQLAEKLRQEPSITCLEGYNARELSPELCQHSPSGQFNFAVMDVSFISQTLILPGLCALLSPGALLVSLVKPQFELGPESIGKGGIVRSAELYPQLEARMKGLFASLGMSVLGYIDSPIKGGDGNREFLLIARKDPPLQ